jgi:hypothetical protein
MAVHVKLGRQHIRHYSTIVTIYLMRVCKHTLTEKNYFWLNRVYSTYWWCWVYLWAVRMRLLAAVLHNCWTVTLHAFAPEHLWHAKFINTILLCHYIRRLVLLLKRYFFVQYPKCINDSVCMIIHWHYMYILWNKAGLVCTIAYLL